jgi:hypothetical protein
VVTRTEGTIISKHIKVEVAMDAQSPPKLMYRRMTIEEMVATTPSGRPKIVATIKDAPLRFTVTIWIAPKRISFYAFKLH